MAVHDASDGVIEDPDGETAFPQREESPKRRWE